MVYYYRSQGARNKNQGMVDYSVDTRFPKENFEKLFKNPLTKYIKYDIIYTSKGDNPKKRKEEKNYGNHKSYKGKKYRIYYA